MILIQEDMVFRKLWTFKHDLKPTVGRGFKGEPDTWIVYSEYTPEN